MKIAGITIERSRAEAVTEKRPPPDMSERGATGTQIFGGTMTQQDYNAALTAPACYDVYDQMRLGDGQVRAGLAAMKLPILRAHWAVESASDKQQDKDIAEQLEHDLRSMSTSFIATLRQILLMIDYGSMLFEPVWNIGEDGMVHLRKLAPRLPRTIMRWYTDQNGGFAGVQQGAILGSGFKPIDIPPEKLVLFVNDQEGSNFRGISSLRAAYKHWYYKEGHYKVDAIANEKRSVGVDIGTIKAGATDKDAIKRGLESSLPTLHAHQKQYFIEDEENFTHRLETGNPRGGQNAIMQTIEHHDLRILRSILAEFLSMGSGSTGSLAMHKDKSSLFLMALEATSDNVAETLTSYLLKPWVDYNWRVTEYPRMKYSRLDTRDTAAIADAVNKLVSVGALTPTPETEEELRNLLDLEVDDVESTQAAAPMPIPAPIPDQIAAIQQRQIARVREQLAAGKSPDEIRLQFKDELVAAIAEAVA